MIFMAIIMVRLELMFGVVLQNPLSTVSQHPFSGPLVALRRKLFEQIRREKPLLVMGSTRGVRLYVRTINVAIRKL
jgi:hypothetical protein